VIEEVDLTTEYSEGEQASESNGTQERNRQERGKNASGLQSGTAVPLRYRAFPLAVAGSDYRLIVESKCSDTCLATLHVRIVGEAKDRPALQIDTAWDERGQLIPILGVGRLGPIELRPGTSSAVKLKLKTICRYALEVSAHAH